MTKPQQTTNLLKQTLAETYTLYLQTQNFHWNVVGEDFYQYHKLFEDQYSEYAEAIDLIAENIRFLDVPAPGSFEQFLKLSSIKITDHTKTTKQMFQILIDQTQTLIKTLKKLEQASEQAGMLDIQDLAIERHRAHQKHLWMLQSTLQT